MTLFRTASRSLLTALAFFLVQAPVHAETLTATIPLGSSARNVAVNPVTNKIYVTTGSQVAVIDGATHARTSVGAGSGVTGGIAINPVTNKIYVTREGFDVTIIDGATNASTHVTVGITPGGMAVNTVTNEIYVANFQSANVAVIDGATGLRSHLIAVGTNPAGLAVNPSTNKVYVANYENDNVTVIDGATKTTTNVAVGTRPLSVAVNPVTNKIYVANQASMNVTVIDGATLATQTIAAGNLPFAVAVNPATNKIYVANYGNGDGTVPPLGDVTVIDGATHVPTSIGAGVVQNPMRFAVNPVTNTIYVMSGPGSSAISVIDGATHGIRNVAVDSFQGDIAVSPVTNRIYVTQTQDGEVHVVDGATNATSTIATGSAPSSVAANPITDKIYVVNVTGSSVTVIDGPTATVATVPVGISPRAIAVNPATNKVYVANLGGNSVTVIDGATNAPTTVAAGSTPQDIALNPLSNKIYVTNNLSNRITVIDGATHATTTITGVASPNFVAVNPATNKIYVTSVFGSSVTVIDGANNTEAVLGSLGAPAQIAVNSVTNKVYVTTISPDRLVVIDGATNTTTSIAVGSSPTGIAINPATNKIYVANQASNNITVIDGASLATTTVPTGSNPARIAVDPVANRIYVTNRDSLNVTVIDGATNVTTTVGAGAAPTAVEVNPVTGKAYVANENAGNVTVITAAASALTNHGTVVAMPGGAVTNVSSPTLSLSVCCAYAPNDPAVRTVYFRKGDGQGAFTAATGTGPFTATLGGLSPGLNFVKLFAVDTMEGTSIKSGGGSISMVGAPKVFAFAVVAPTITTASPLPAGQVGVDYILNLAASGGSGALSFSVTGGTLPAGMGLSPAGFLGGTPTEAGFFSFTVTVTDGAGGSSSKVFALTTRAQFSEFTPRLGGVSTRMQVLTGDDVVIGGFIIGGSTPKTVVIRARGPSLAGSGIANPLANPMVQLVSNQTVIASNDDWQAAANAAAIEASGFAPASPLESAILITLSPGAYTALVSGSGGGTGVGLIEIYELDHPEIPISAISTRGPVLTGDDVMIGGFVINGTSPQTVIVRARGPSLTAQGVAGALANPTLVLSGHNVMVGNDDWGDAPNAAQIAASGFAPSHPRESAILITLNPGAYTAIVSGGSRGGTGVGIVEVFAQ